MSILDKITGMNKKQLENLLQNARERNDRPGAAEIIKECEKELLKYQPKAGFQRRLQEVMEELGTRHGLMKLPGNRVKDGVSPGGAMRAGWFTAEFYIGFKGNDFRRSAVLGGVIQERESDIEFWVYDRDYPVKQDGPLPEWLPSGWDLGFPRLRTHDAEEAVALFKEIISPFTSLETEL